MLDTPQIVTTPELQTAVVDVDVARADIVAAMDAALAELDAVLRAQGLAPSGPCFSLHPRRPGERFVFEVGFPVASPVRASGRVRPGRLPATRAVRTHYRGGYDGLGAAWGEFSAWIEGAGLAVGAPLWEAYLVGPADSPAPQDWRTELNRPLAD